MKPEALEKSICTTCNKLENCFHSKSDQGPIINCEDFDDYIVAEVAELVEKHDKLLISILEGIQKHHNYLPENALREVSKQLKIPMRDIYGVASFYKAFSLKPRGKHLVSACLGTACHVRGAKPVIGEFEKLLEINAGETTADNEISFETVNCLGACALGPVVVVDGKYYTSVKKADIKNIVKTTIEGEAQIDILKDRRIFPIEVSCPRCNHSLMDFQHNITFHPSILFSVSYNHKMGWYRMSSLYGSNNFTSEFEIPKNTELSFFCTHCNNELIGYTDCPECNSKMVPLIVHGGGIVHFCPRQGCHGHLLDI